MNRINQLIILGNHIQSLGLSRLGAKIGLKVVLFNIYRACVTRFSNTCKQFVLYNDEEDLLQKLHDYSSQSLLVATNDEMVHFLAKHYDELSKRFYMSIPSPEIEDICYNKINTYRVAKEAGIPIPESHFPSNQKEIEALTPVLEYPVILKPAIMHTFHKSTGKKVYFCGNRDQLIENYQRITQVIDPNQVIVQEFLSGGTKALFSFGSFFANGEVYGSFVANRIRQKPMDFGVSTSFAKTIINQEIDDLATRFLKHINYFGLSEVEFLYDHRTKEYKLLEINPRSWKWHTIANQLDMNLLDMMVKYLQNDPIDRKKNALPDIGWIERLTDTYVALGEMSKGQLSIKDYWRSLQIRKESATWSSKDPMPAIAYLLLAPYLLIKRN